MAHNPATPTSRTPETTTNPAPPPTRDLTPHTPDQHPQ
ncbi:hypothetical protein I547_3589 [Mycobacterium kansasii 824]|nr:hypothetical protein I547_3589 [Mycobacterium kansasii 824]